MPRSEDRSIFSLFPFFGNGIFLWLSKTTRYPADIVQVNLRCDICPWNTVWSNTRSLASGKIAETRIPKKCWKCWLHDFKTCSFWISSQNTLGLGENWCCLSGDLWVANWLVLTGWGQKEDRELIAGMPCRWVRVFCAAWCGRLVWLVGRGLKLRADVFMARADAFKATLNNWHMAHPSTWLTSPRLSWHR